MKILQVSATDFGGGAAKVAWDLHNAFKLQNHTSWLAVGKKRTQDQDVIEIPNDRPQNMWELLNFSLAKQAAKFIGTIRGAGLATNFFKSVGRYKNMYSYFKGNELFDYPGTKSLLNLFAQPPDILHCHNLHSKYFDLRMLSYFSHQVTTVLTLHDTWLLSGHCAYAKTCQRWQTGCGNCPDLSLYPAIRKDNTAFNWRLKKKIYQASQLHVVTPCKWLMNKVENSMLMPGVQTRQVIHNGVDVDFFIPGDKQAARIQLGLNPQEFILFFVANSVRNNIWKDFSTLKQAMEICSVNYPDPKIRLICFGDDAPQEFAGHIPIEFIPHTDDLTKLVQYYQAADVYLHAARADTFPTVILEALACGLPVVATAIDGIGEQVIPLNEVESYEPYMEHVKSASYDEATGVLVERGDAAAFARWIGFFLQEPLKLEQLALNARRCALKKYSFCRQVDDYLRFYIQTAAFSQ